MKEERTQSAAESKPYDNYIPVIRIGMGDSTPGAR
jgi:hypothetical protein